MTPVIEAKGLVKRYGEFTAVDGIDFAVEEGECFGLLGSNGAGKTSTIRMIGCVSPVSEGELWVAGHNVSTEGRAIKALNLPHQVSVSIPVRISAAPIHASAEIVSPSQSRPRTGISMSPSPRASG